MSAFRRGARPAVLLAVALAVAVLAVRSGNPAVAVLVVAALVCGAGLVALAPSGSAEAAMLERGFAVAPLALPALLVIYFSFSAGGFFPDAPAVVVLVLLGVLLLRAFLLEDPFAGFTPGLAVAAIAMAGLTAWTLLSGTWSASPSRALIEADRALMYLLVLVLLGSVPRSPERLAWALRGTAAALVVVAAAALATRLAPDIFAASPNLANNRLSFPLTYWNGLGLAGVLAAILCLWLTSSVREPAASRVLAAGAIPIVAAMVLFTFSRGAIAVAALGLPLFVVLARPRGLLSALVATGPATAVALVSAYGADLLATARPTTAAAAAQGHDVALVLAGCVVAAAGLRALLLPLDARVAAVRLAPGRGRLAAASAWGVAAVCVVMLALALDAPTRLEQQYRRVVDTTNVAPSADLRDRLTDPSNNGRVGQWRVGMAIYRLDEVQGAGAGTFGLEWSQRRPATLGGTLVRDTHSLYVETLAELGLVGLILVVTVLLAILVAFLPLRRGEDRALYAALTAAGVTWAVHAGIDWDWELPAVTAWLFGLGGLALAAPIVTGGPPRGATGSGTRLGVGLAALLAVPGPALVLVSQTRIDRAVAAFNRGDCRAAGADATAANGALNRRPEPFEVRGFCRAREGAAREGVPLMEAAVAREPTNWEYQYGLALVQGAAGMDPRPAARRALALNPLDPLARELVELTRDRRRWRAVTTERVLREGLSVVR